MAVYTAAQLNIKPPSGGFTQGGWFAGRQYYNGTFSDPGVIHPQSPQQGAGSAVSQEVNAQSAAAQGLSPQQLESYLASERAKQQAAGMSGAPGGGATSPGGAGSGYTPRTFSPEEQAMIDQAKGQFKQPTINLPEMYKSLYKDSGIEGISEQLSAKEKAYNTAVSGINDNPYYSEATRTGRLAKLEDQYQRDTQSLKNDIATRKADIETQININSKQFDIDSDQAKQARDQFNTLLQLGALDNATGEDIAAIVRTTGISSTMLQSAINANREKNVQTSMVSFDDGTNQGFAVVNSKTGEIISRQTVGASGKAADYAHDIEMQNLKNAEKTSSGGGGGSNLTPAQATKVTTVSRKAVQEQDGNKDRRLSQAEYTAAVQKIMTESGVDYSTADNYAEAAFNDLGYSKWRW